MKKLKLIRKSIDELAISMPVIGDLEQKGLIGGGDGTRGNPWTLAEYHSHYGCFFGGYVDFGEDGVIYIGSSFGNGDVSQTSYSGLHSMQYEHSFLNYVPTEGVGVTGSLSIKGAVSASDNQVYVSMSAYVANPSAVVRGRVEIYQNGVKTGEQLLTIPENGYITDGSHYSFVGESRFNVSPNANTIYIRIYPTCSYGDSSGYSGSQNVYQINIK